jgi:hypothetical protein
MCKCNQRNCDLEVFENSNKCILHCEKDDWLEEFNEKTVLIKTFLYNQNKNWLSTDTKINLFLEKFINFINEEINSESKKIVLDKIRFPSISNSNFPEIRIFKIKFLIFKDCIFLDNIDLTPFFYAKNLEITNCTFHENVDIQTIIHQEQFVFQKNSVLKEIKFFNIEFKSICFFVENNINKLTFNGVRFDDNAIFSNSKIEDLSFKNSFFRKETNFLDMTLSEVGNRETARIIKDSFEQQNNIIEANKFYALEMKEREKELKQDRKEGKNFFEWLVFKIHGLSSNHSQDWLLALYWIFIIGFISSYYDFNLIQHEGKYVHYELSLVFKTIGLIFVVLFFYSICKIKDKLVNGSYFIICFYLVYTYSTEDYLLSLFSKTINPFSVMKTNDAINGIQLLFKIIIAYLIYQLIISIRQNTRRK